MSLLDEDEMPHRVTIKGPPTLVRDSGGGTNPTWPTTAAAGVPCQIMFGSSGESNEFSQSQFERNTNTIAFNESRSSVLVRGYLIVDDVTGDSYRITNISRKQGIGGIPDYLIVSVTQVE